MFSPVLFKKETLQTFTLENFELEFSPRLRIGSFPRNRQRGLTYISCKVGKRGLLLFWSGSSYTPFPWYLAQKHRVSQLQKMVI